MSSATCARPRFRRWLAIDITRDFIAGLTKAALIVEDASADPGDDYLFALAREAAADFQECPAIAT